MVLVPICHSILPDVSITMTRLNGGKPVSAMTTQLSWATGTSSMMAIVKLPLSVLPPTPFTVTPTTSVRVVSFAGCVCVCAALSV